MATKFPVQLDTFTTPDGQDTLSVIVHHAQHSNENDAIKALEAKVGIDGSAVTTSLDYLVSTLLDGDIEVGSSVAISSPAAQAGSVRLINNVAPAYAQGVITLAAYPTAGKHIVISERSYSWVSGSPAADNDISRGASLDDSKNNFLDAINNGDDITGIPNADLTAGAFNYSGAATINDSLLIATNVGTAGNSITLGGNFTDDAGNLFNAPTLGHTQTGVDGTYTGFVEARNALGNGDVLLLGLDSAGRTVLSDASTGMGVYIDPTNFQGLYFVAGELGAATLVFSGARDPSDLSYTAPIIQISVQPTTGSFNLTGASANSVNVFRPSPPISMYAKQWDGTQSQSRQATITTEETDSSLSYGTYRLSLNTTGTAVGVGNGALILDNSNASGRGIVSLNNAGTAYETMMRKNGTHVEIGVGDIVMPSLPSSDPHVVGKLYTSSGTLKVSAG